MKWTGVSGSVLYNVCISSSSDSFQDFVGKLQALRQAESAFTLRIRDPSGNSFVENPRAPNEDPQLKIIHFRRNLEEMKLLALVADDAEEIARFFNGTTKLHKQQQKLYLEKRHDVLQHLVQLQDFNGTAKE